MFPQLSSLEIILFQEVFSCQHLIFIPCCCFVLQKSDAASCLYNIIRSMGRFAGQVSWMCYVEKEYGMKPWTFTSNSFVKYPPAPDHHLKSIELSAPHPP